MVQLLWKTFWWLLKKPKHNLILGSIHCIPKYLPNYFENLCPGKNHEHL